MALSPVGLVCAREDGSVSLYDVATGCFTQELYRHKASVRILEWMPEKKTILSICVSNRVQSWSLGNLRSEPSCETRLPNLDARLDHEGHTITHVTIGEKVSKLLLSTHLSDHVWDIDTGREVSHLHYRHDDHRNTRIWIQHPTSPEHLVCIRQETADIYTWKEWTQVVSVDLGTSLVGLQIKSSARYTCARETRVLLELEEIDGSADTKQILSVTLSATQSYHDMEATSQSSTASNPVATVLPINILRRVAHVIGIHATPSSSKMMFLDTNSWVCSIDLGTVLSPSSAGMCKSYTRHFFVPYDWFAGSRRLSGLVTPTRGVVFGKGGDVSVVKGGLDFSEVVSLESMSDETKVGREM